MKDHILELRNAQATIEYLEDRCKMLELKLESRSCFEKAIGKINNRIRRSGRNRKKKPLPLNTDGLNNVDNRKEKVIVSLTSYPGRINSVSETIKTLLNQTYKPDKVILWLGEEKFPDKKLPDVFNELQKAGLTVNFRPDLKSHTKYFYAIQEYPDDIIITVDDDCYYENSLIQKLIESYQKHPTMVSAMRVHKIRFNDDYSIKKYSEWIYEYSGKIGSSSHAYMATGVGGVLYPPKVLSSEVTNLDVIKNYCHNHDDWWLKIMEVMNGTKVVLAADSKMRTFSEISGTQKSAQWRENVVNGGNDRQMNATLDYYSSWVIKEKTLLEILALDL